MQDAITPPLALQLLENGNTRFIKNLKENRDLLQQANETSKEQHPFAIILSCIDSRTSAELIFDQGLGDIFSIRVAGAVIGEDILGSLEFACKVAGAKIIVVLGHSNCGAIKGACDDVDTHDKSEMTNLTCVLSKIKPAIHDETTTVEKRTSRNLEFVANVTAIHTEKTVKAIMEGSKTLKDLITKGECGIIGGHHELETGQVTFHPKTKYGFFKPEPDERFQSTSSTMRVSLV